MQDVRQILLAQSNRGQDRLVNVGDIPNFLALKMKRIG